MKDKHPKHDDVIKPEDFEAEDKKYPPVSYKPAPFPAPLPDSAPFPAPLPDSAPSYAKTQCPACGHIHDACPPATP